MTILIPIAAAIILEIKWPRESVVHAATNGIPVWCIHPNLLCCNNDNKSNGHVQLLKVAVITYSTLLYYSGLPNTTLGHELN